MTPLGALRKSLGALLFAITVYPAAAASDSADLSDFFGPFQGCALLETRDRYGERRIEFRPDQCRQAQSPCSTFKVPNALIGLETGAVSGPDDLKTWDGIQRERDVTNRDHTLASAMHHSVVWYFQQLARDIGPEAMQAWLDRLDYGNRDISGGIDRFWLGSSLQIDGFGQLTLVEALWRDALPFAPEHQQQVRDMLAQASSLPGRLHGKTGSCRGDPAEGTEDHGWFIGWIDWDKRNNAGPATTFFVINITGENAWGWNARDIAFELLKEQQP